MHINKNVRYHADVFLFSTFNIKIYDMQELIEKLKTEAGLTDEQAQKAVTAIKDYVVEKFPMLEGAVGSLFGQD